MTAYSQQDITVAVNTGEVSVSRQQHGATAREMIVLTENEAASFTHQTQELTKMDPEEITLNQDFYKADFHFENRPLSQVFELIENRYGVDISYNETKIEQCMLNASLVGIPLEDKIRLICKTSNLSYTINRDKIVIKGEGCEIL
ncbi:MAG: DUF4974 domain-containing protein [Cyclobacteriaceae bacterium]|nr:DUF4974 domain-containing protein [Cyclobacteriaceae bacterium]